MIQAEDEVAVRIVWIAVEKKRGFSQSFQRWHVSLYFGADLMHAF